MSFLNFGITSILSAFCMILVSTDQTPQLLHHRAKRLTYGVDSYIWLFPFLVSLELNSSHHCGGSIISPSHIITAAHCLRYDKNPSSYRIRAGSSLSNQKGSEHQVANLSIHKDYTRSRNFSEKNDLAILHLLTPIQLDNITTKVIDMFEHGQNVSSGSIGRVAGWGRLGYDGPWPNRVQSIELRVVDQKSCLDSRRGKLKKGQICAYDPGKIQSACNGDSGGPLVVDGKLAGVYSYATRCTSAPYPNVFTEIAYYRKWIDDRLYESGFEFSNYYSLKKKLNDVNLVIRSVRKNHEMNLNSPERTNFDYFIEKRLNENKKRLGAIFGNNVDTSCGEVYKNQSIIFKEKVNTYIRRVVMEQLNDDGKLLKSTEKLSEEIEQKLSQCPNDASCNFSEIKDQIDKIDKIIRYLLFPARRLKHFIFAKYERYIASYAHKFIFMPVDQCMGSNTRKHLETLIS